MGTNLTVSLEQAPQLGVEVCHPALHLDGDTREVLRCPACQLRQFRTQNSLCRRCRAGLDVVAAPPPAPLAAFEPGAETAEASGEPVPNVALALRAWRQRQHLSQRQLAERMHVPRTYVSKIENDKATPTLASLERMAHAMETSVAALLRPRAAEPAENFLQALESFLPQLTAAQLDRLLDVSRQLAQA